VKKNPLCVLMCASLISAHAAAATFTVVNTNDSGPGSLRQAIVDGVASTVGSAAHDTVIAFNIPGAGVHTIRPTSSLPAIKDLLIDGYTQPGSRANTLAIGSDAVLDIEIDGSLAGAGANGLVNLGAVPGTGVPTVTIRGLVINRFAGSGIRVTGPSGAGFPGFAIIEGNFIGTDATGTEARGNGIGIELGIGGQTIIGEQTPDLGGNTLPFPAHRNLISGNVGAGIKFDSSDPHEPALGTVRGAYIGTDAQGLAPLGNGGDGVYFGPEAGVGSLGLGSFVYLYDNVIAANAGDGLDTQSVGTQAVNNTIGSGVDARALGNQMNGAYFHGGSIGSLAAPFAQQGAAGPRVANNAGAGVLIADGALVEVTGPIVNNGGLGIDIAPLGPNTNDAGDADGGPNESLNAPVITSAVSAVASTRIQGSFSTRPNSSVEVWLFANPTCNASGFGEAARLLGSVNGVTAAADGTASFDRDFAFSLDRNAFPYVVAMARRFVENPAALPSPHEVSEFSACFAVTGGAPLPTLSVNDASVPEGNAGTATATFTVSLSAAAAGPVTVSYATADGTATAGTDYSAASGTLTFTAGQTTKTVAVSVTGDSSVEPNETFALNISGPAGAAIVDGSGEGTIVNDDVPPPPPPLPTLSIANVNVTEGNAGTTTATFTVTLSAAAAGAVSVNYATADGTASSGGDYVAGSGTLSFTAGETSKTLAVTVNGDTVVEPDETFTVSLSAASGATLAAASAQGTITNDDVAPSPPPPGGGGGGAMDWELLAMLAACLLVARLRGATCPNEAMTLTPYSGRRRIDSHSATIEPLPTRADQCT
jgi:hypothetical protein